MAAVHKRRSETGSASTSRDYSKEKKVVSGTSTQIVGAVFHTSLRRTVPFKFSILPLNIFLSSSVNPVNWMV